MTCLEARREFPAFWRRAMPSASRARLVAHLHGCAECDRAFRAFALSAPVLHSELVEEAMPQASPPPLNLVRPRRFAVPRSAPLARGGTWRTWKIAAAASLMITIGGLSAWSSVRWPSENFAESVAGDGVDVDRAIYSSDSATADSFTLDSSTFDLTAGDPAGKASNGAADENSL